MEEHIKIEKLQQLRRKEIENLSDELNPDYLFHLTYTELLVKIAKGEIDTVALAKEQLRHRGLNINGEWVGWKQLNA